MSSPHPKILKQKLKATTKVTLRATKNVKRFGASKCVYEAVFTNYVHFFVAYANYLDDQATVENITDVSGYIVDRAEESLDAYGREYIVAAMFEGTDPATSNQSLIATALFNNQPFHAISVSLSAMGNALLQLFVGETYSITTFNHPLPRTEDDRIEDELTTAAATAFTVSIMMIFGMSFLVATFVVFLIKAS